MATKPLLTGGCLCGGVRYEIDEPLVSASYCHCTRCQRRTGSGASAQARIEPGSLRVVAGTFDGDPGIRPQWHQFVAYASTWEPVPDDGLPRYPEGKPAS
jgi:hypothetical protein